MFLILFACFSPIFSRQVVNTFARWFLIAIFVYTNCPYVVFDTFNHHIHLLKAFKRRIWRHKSSNCNFCNMQAFPARDRDYATCDDTCDIFLRGSHDVYEIGD